MKRGILLLNGEPYEGRIDDSDALVVCCDGAYAWAHGKVRIDKNVGDFDSLPYIPTPAPEEIYPAEKDYTDGEIAMIKLLDAGVDQIEIYGGGGKREDHFLGNIQLLYLAAKRGARAEMITAYSRIFVGFGRVNLDGNDGATLSVFPFGGEAHIMGSAGLKYSYPPKLCYGQCIGVSNVAVSDSAHIEVAEGDFVLIIINRGDV